MPYKEIGTPQPFEQWETLTATEYAVVGQFGFRGYQPSLATPSMDLNTLDLNQIKSSIDSFAKLNVKYMRISWNQMGTIVTDFVFGMVADIKKPVNVLDLWSMLPANLVQAFTQLNFTGDAFTASLLGLKQNAYTYTWVWEAYSDEYVLNQTESPPTDDTLKSTFISTGQIDQALEAFKTEALKYGATITVKAYTITLAHADFVKVVRSPQGMDKNVYRTHLILTVDYDSSLPLTTASAAQSFLGWILFCIGVAIIILAAGGVLWFIGLSTYHSTNTTRITNNTDQPITVHTPQGDVTIPPHSSWEYSEDVSGGGASWIAQLPLIFIGISTVIVLAVVLPKVFPSKERR